MGISASKALARSSVIDPFNSQNNEVDRMLRAEEEKERYHFKVLLLGAGESGKSTVLKQLKMLAKVPISAQEREECKDNIRWNTIECMQIVLREMTSLDLSVAESNQATREKFLTSDPQNLTYNDNLVREMETLQQDPAFAECFSRKNEYWVLDAIDYFFEHMWRFAEPDFDPTEEDLVMARVRTTGIVVSPVEDPPLRFSIVDVGGQRSERRKWIHCFDDVKALIFLVGLSGYNQVLFEDGESNRLKESLTLFEEIVQNPIFANTPIFLLLNKKDLFETMIKEQSLRKEFPEYDGPEQQAMPAAEFIKEKFLSLALKHRPNTYIGTHIVAARVRMDMKGVFKDLKAKLNQIYHPKENLSRAAELGCFRWM